MRKSLSAIFWIGFLSVAQAQTAPPAAPSDQTPAGNADLGDWIYRCNTTAQSSGCVITELVKDPQTSRLKAEVLIGYYEGKRTFFVNLPFNTLLPQGAQLVLGNGARKIIPFEACHSNGCLAADSIDDDFENSLATAPTLDIATADLNNGITLTSVSVKGLAAALKMLDAGNR